MVLHAGAVEMAADDPGKVHVLAEQMQVAGRRALQELRQLVGLLRENDDNEPAPLTPQPTLADLPEMVEESRLAGMDVTLQSNGQVRILTDMVERTAYRIVQESLTNAGRHATGASVCVTLDYRPTTLTVNVVNHKATGTANTVPGTGEGLLGLRERAHALGGTLRADPRLDGGFAVEAVSPRAHPAATRRRRGPRPIRVAHHPRPTVRASHRPRRPGARRSRSPRVGCP